MALFLFLEHVKIVLDIDPYIGHCLCLEFCPHGASHFILVFWQISPLLERPFLTILHKIVSLIVYNQKTCLLFLHCTLSFLK